MTDSETTAVHRRRSEFDVYIGRHRRDGELRHMNNTEPTERGWIGNPYKTKSAGGKYTRSESIDLFREDFYDRLDEDPEFRAAFEGLEGKTLGCWCKPADCHGDVIADYLDSPQTGLGEFGGDDGGW